MVNSNWLQDKQMILLGIVLVISILSLIFTFTAQGNSTPAAETTSLTQPEQPAVATAPVTIIIVKDSQCTDCVDISPLVQELAQAGVNITQSTTLELADAKNAIDTYSLTRAPAIIISPEIKEYTEVYELLSSLVREANDGSAIIENYAPYVDVATRNVRGLVTVTYLSDASCEECYDVTLHKQVLARLSMGIKNEVFVDVESTEGKELLKYFQITKVPTILLSSEAKEYPAILQVWPTVGRTDTDGTFVFEQTEAMGTYKNLETNEIISK